MPKQISLQQFNDLVDVLGGLYGPEEPIENTQVPQTAIPLPKSFQKAVRPQTKPTRAPNVPSLRALVANQRVSRPIAAQPYQPVKTELTEPTPEEKQSQEQLLEAVKAGAEKSGRGSGTQLAQVLRARRIDPSIVSQFEAAGVPSLDLLAKVLNGQQITQVPKNLAYFTDDSSPFVVLSQPRTPLKGQNIPAVVVGLPYAGLVHELEEAFPGVHFFSVEETPKELQKAASQTAKPMNTKSLLVPLSRFGKYFKKSDREKESNPQAQPTQPTQPKKGSIPEVESHTDTVDSSSPSIQETSPDSTTYTSVRPADGPVNGIGNQLTNLESVPSTEEIENQPTDFLEPEINPQDPDQNAPYEIQNERKWTSNYEEQKRVAIEFAERYKSTQPSTKTTYNARLPTEKELASGDFKSFYPESNHEEDIGKVVVAEQTYFYKGGFYSGKFNRSSIRNEIVASRFGQILDVPVPTARQVKPIQHKEEPIHSPHRALLTAWIEGHTVNDIIEGLAAANHNSGIIRSSLHERPAAFISTLERLVKPGDIDLQIFFSFVFRLADRHEANYMVSGNRLVSIDHEYLNSLEGGNLASNSLFELKALQESQKNSSDTENNIPLSREVAGDLASRIQKSKKLWQQMIKKPEHLSEIEQRTECLRRFSQGSSDTSGSFYKIQESVFPNRDWDFDFD